MMPLDPHLLYPSARFFLDFIAGRASAMNCFQTRIDQVERVVPARQSVVPAARRDAVSDALYSYNASLGASPRAMELIDQLRDERTLCVLGGQQAGFLGGPLLVLYKIVCVLRTASLLSHQLALPVIPIFWLATEDHDLDEIAVARWVDAAGALQTRRFGWLDRGRPIEALPLTQEILSVYYDVIRQIPCGSRRVADALAPQGEDTYASWHARFWSQLFAEDGLVVMEPSILRPLAQPFFSRAIRDRAHVRDALRAAADAIQLAGYDLPLDPTRDGTLFTTRSDGLRRRLGDPGVIAAEDDPGMLSPDVALRPLLADSILPTVAHVLGPSELSYHAMLKPLYALWNLAQPCPVPRPGATVLAQRDAEMLHRAGLEVADLIGPTFSPGEWAIASTSDHLSRAFDTAKDRVRDVLHPLKEELSALDRGLEARWRQAVDQAVHPLDRLRERAVRAELSTRGISVKAVQRSRETVWPSGRPQERVLSAYSVLAVHGVEWAEDWISRWSPDRFEHTALILEEPHEQS